MKRKSWTAPVVISAVAIMLLAAHVLAGCGGSIGEQFSSIGKSLKPSPTATALPPTSPPATATPSPTSAPPTPVPPSPTATSRPTGTPTLTPSVTPTPGPDAVVTADALTLRGGPGTVYARLGTLRKGDSLTVTARTAAGDWLAVTTQAGKKGWVAAAYVDLNLPPDEIPLAAEVPPTPTPPPTQPPTAPPEQAPGEGQPPPTSPPPAPTSGLSVDDQIAKINRGEHGQLPQPPVVGSVEAGGEAELTILNDTPFVLTVLIGLPNQTIVTVEKCPTCSTYGFTGPIGCQEKGRPRQTVRVKPGTMKVAARVDNPSVIPFSGEWTLNADSAYFYCFYIVTR
jgi:hypothetical protein